MRRADFNRCGIGLILGCMATPAGHALAAEDAAPVLVFKSSLARVAPGQEFSVDAYLVGRTNLAVYQIQVQFGGGDSGGLILQGMTVDKSRSDFVFANGGSVLDAADMTAARVGAIRMAGNQEVDKSAYLATFTFKASADAKGTFKINARPGPETFVTDSNSKDLGFQRGSDIEIAVGAVAPTRVETRSRDK